LRELLAGKRVGLVLVGSGPGSYSGTRVGIAAAQGVAIAMDCPAVAVPSILAVPSAVNACLAIGDARRSTFWTAGVEKLRLKSAPALCDADTLHHEIARAWSAAIPVFSFEDPARFPLQGGTIRLEYPDAAALWRAWSSADGLTRSEWMAEPPQPLYLKPPHITKGRGALLDRL
jgi:tRNA A37 threonylcarbamoyladenosine modification protein TsaB